MKLNYFLIPLITIITSIGGNLATSKGMDWYKTLNLPRFTPPGSTIGLVWTVIFILTTISALIFWNQVPRGQKFYLITFLFLTNAFLNFFWSLLFFGLQQIGIAILEMVILEATVVSLIILLWPLSRLASLLLVTYGVWVIFATFLAISVWRLN